MRAMRMDFDDHRSFINIWTTSFWKQVKKNAEECSFVSLCRQKMDFLEGVHAPRREKRNPSERIGPRYIFNLLRDRNVHRRPQIYAAVLKSDPPEDWKQTRRTIYFFCSCTIFRRKEKSRSKEWTVAVRRPNSRSIDCTTNDAIVWGGGGAPVASSAACVFVRFFLNFIATFYRLETEYGLGKWRRTAIEFWRINLSDWFAGRPKRWPRC